MNEIWKFLRFGSASITLYSLANLVLHNNWLSLLNDKAARPYKHSGLEAFQLLVSGLEFHLDDYIDDQIIQFGLERGAGETRASSGMGYSGVNGSANTYKNYQKPSSLRPGSHPRPDLALALYLPRHRKRDTPGRRSCLWSISESEPVASGESLGILLDDSMRVQPHMFPAGIVMDIICTMTNQSGINCWVNPGSDFTAPSIIAWGC